MESNDADDDAGAAPSYPTPTETPDTTPITSAIASTVDADDLTIEQLQRLFAAVRADTRAKFQDVQSEDAIQAQAETVLLPPRASP